MDAIEERLRRGMTERGVDAHAQQEILQYISSFALYGFPESHSASFALIAYASAYLKCHHPAAFLAGLLNAYPMGFYNPATLVKDAQRHGVVVQPIDVSASYEACTLEDTPSAVRIGLRYAGGLRTESAEAIVRERNQSPFCDLPDLTKRVPLQRDEIAALAELGALASLDAAPRRNARRAALWQVAALERDARSLFAGLAPEATRSAAASPLPEMTPIERTLADYRLAGLTTGPQLLAHLRKQLRARGILSAMDLRRIPDGRFVRTAGHVIVRQHPGTAKGFTFLTLEDETGTSNAILTPKIFQRYRAPLSNCALIEIAGPLQNAEGVIHVKVQKLAPLSTRGSVERMPARRDFR